MCQDEPGYLMCVHDRIKSIQCHRLLLPHVFSSKLKARILSFSDFEGFYICAKNMQANALCGQLFKRI